MKDTDHMFRFAFNMLVDLLANHYLINSYNHTRDDCEKTLDCIRTITDKMKVLFDKMED